MMVMTAKLNFKKILMLLSAAAALILAAILLLGGGDPAAPTSAPSMAENAHRVDFLRDMGWQVKDEPVQAGKVKMPRQTSAVYERYNNLQKSQGYDLSDYAGKKAMRYVYEVTNYPGAGDPVFATILVFQDRIIGGDVTDTGKGGKIQGLRREAKQAAPTHPKETEAVPSLPAEMPQ